MFTNNNILKIANELYIDFPKERFYLFKPLEKEYVNKGCLILNNQNGEVFLNKKFLSNNSVGLF